MQGESSAARPTKSRERPMAGAPTNASRRCPLAPPCHESACFQACLVLAEHPTRRLPQQKLACPRFGQALQNGGDDLLRVEPRERRAANAAAVQAHCPFDGWL